MPPSFFWGFVGSPWAAHLDLGDFDGPWCFPTQEMPLLHCLLPSPPLTFRSVHKNFSCPCSDYFGNSSRMSTHKEDRTIQFCPLSLALIPKTWCSGTTSLPKLTRHHWTTLLMVGHPEGSGLGSERWAVRLCSRAAQE